MPSGVGLEALAVGHPPVVGDAPWVAAAETRAALGPVLIRIPCASLQSRFWAGVWCLGCVTLLVVAALVTPDPSGVGTHTQLGAPPCSSMMLWGVPCPTCGMTTAFAHTVRGQWLSAIRVQPAGWLAAVATALCALVTAVTVVTGRKWAVNWYRAPPGRVAVSIVAIVLLAWLYRVSVAVRLL